MENNCSEINDKNSIKYLKINKFKTNLKKYDMFNYYSNDLPFKNYFPNLYTFLEKFNNNFTSNTTDPKEIDSDIKNFIIKNLDVIENDINKYFCDEWNNLVYLSGRTKVHIIITVILVFLDIEILDLSESDANIVLWSLLLHDIAKHVILDEKLGENFNPNMKRSDKIHPFKSGALALKIFQKNNFFLADEEISQNELDKIIESIYSLLIKSVEFKEFKNNSNYYIQSLSFMDEILINLEKLKKSNLRNKYLSEIFVLVTFHQSLPNMKSHLNKPLLDYKLIEKIFDIRLLELMRIVMVNDSAAHSLFSTESFTDEVNENLNNVSNLLKV